MDAERTPLTPEQAGRSVGLLRFALVCLIVVGGCFFLELLLASKSPFRVASASIMALVLVGIALLVRAGERVIRGRTVSGAQRSTDDRASESGARARDAAPLQSEKEGAIVVTHPFDHVVLWTCGTLALGAIVVSRIGVRDTQVVALGLAMAVLLLLALEAISLAIRIRRHEAGLKKTERQL